MLQAPAGVAPAIRLIPATAGILIGIFLAAVEATVVGTAMPTVIAELGGVELYFLPVAVYMITATVMVPVFGRLCDLYGRRVFHLIGIFLFLVGSALCARAESMKDLILFRALQGIGGGALMPLSFTMIADLFPLEARAKMQGAISGVWGLAALVGPPAGGLITEAFDWRGVFLVNIPFGLLSLVIVQVVWKDSPRSGPRRQVDVPGATLLMLASFTLMAAFGLAGYGAGWLSLQVLGAFATAIVLVAALVAVERRARDPFLSFDLFRIRIFWSGTVCGAFAATLLFCATTFVPLFVQGVVGSNPTGTGMSLTPMMLSWVTLSSASGFLLLRFGYRNLAFAGLTLAIAAYALFVAVGPEATWGRVALSTTLLGAGLGCVMAPLLIAAQNSVPRDELGAATSLTQFSRTMAGALGLGVMGAVMSSTLRARLALRPDLKVQPETVVHHVYRGTLPPEVSEALRDILAGALHPVFVIGLVAAVLGLAAAFLLPRGRARELAMAELPAVEALRTPGSPQ